MAALILGDVPLRLHILNGGWLSQAVNSLSKISFWCPVPSTSLRTGLARFWLGRDSKRGCQEKTLLPSLEKRSFSDIQPLSSSLAAEVRSSLVALMAALRHHSGFWRLHKPGGGHWPTMVLSETRAEARHYGRGAATRSRLT